MTSFYGGRAGIPFVIKKDFRTYSEMVEAFNKGYEYSEVGYGEYAIVNNDDISDEYRGKVYRRGYSGPEEIGQFKGPRGSSMKFRGDFDPCETYYLNDAQTDVVFYEGSSYVRVGDRKEASYTPPNEDTENWHLLVKQGPTGPAGSGGSGGTANSVEQKRLTYEDLNNIKDDKYTYYYANTVDWDDSEEEIQNAMTLRNAPTGTCWEEYAGTPVTGIPSSAYFFDGFALTNQRLSEDIYYQEVTFKNGDKWHRYSSNDVVNTEPYIDENGFNWGVNGGSILNYLFKWGRGLDSFSFSCYSCGNNYYISSLLDNSDYNPNNVGSPSEGYSHETDWDYEHLKVSPTAAPKEGGTWKLDPVTNHFMYYSKYSLVTNDLNNLKLYYCSGERLGDPCGEFGYSWTPSAVTGDAFSSPAWAPHMKNRIIETYCKNYAATKWTPWERYSSGGGSYGGPTGPTGPCGMSWIASIEPVTGTDSSFTLYIRPTSTSYY